MYSNIEGLNFLFFDLYFETCLLMVTLHMSIWQRLFISKHLFNSGKNNIACIENDCACKSNEQLLYALQNTGDEGIAIGIKRVLISRGYSKRELNSLQHTIH